MEIPADVLSKLKVKKHEEVEPKSKPIQDSKPKEKSKEEVRRDSLARKHKAWLSRDPGKYNRVMEILWENFPKVFNPYYPLLKIGIYKDIRERLEIPARDLTFVLNTYCKGLKYLQSFKEGALRYDLDGNPDREVDAEEVAVAKKMFDEKMKYFKEQLK